MARDSDRIRETLDAIQALWEQHPDQRLGQLLENLSWEADKDLFYIEDNEIVATAEHVTHNDWSPKELQS